MSIAQKILARAAGRKRVEPGEIVEARVDVAMAHDLTAPMAIEGFESIAQKVWSPERVVFVFDHQWPADSIEVASDHAAMREFAARQRIRNLYDEGICHQLLPEKGFALPGSLIVGADSHTCTCGAFGSFATGIGSTDMAAVLAEGKLWFKVPENVRVRINGKLRKLVAPKDLILRLIGEIGADGATYRAIEFGGECMRNLTIAGRMTLCNMGVEAGAKTAIVPPDRVTKWYLKRRARKAYKPVLSDSDAEYVEELDQDASELEPQVACPHSVDNVRSVREVQGVEIDQAFLGSCTNGRVEDLKEAARVVRGKRVHRRVRMIVTPASREVYSEAIGLGLLGLFVRAGATVSHPNCSACMGSYIGVLGPGEACVSTSNRNFRGRQGSPDAEIYLASPATVAASALKGEITDPRDV